MIRTKLTQKDYINLNFALLLKRPIIKVFIGIYLVFLTYSLFTEMPSARSKTQSILFSLIILLMFPLLTYFNIRKTFASNKTIQETIEYTYDNTTLYVTAESASSQQSWDKVYKVILIKNWLLIYQSSQIVNAIPRRDIQSSDLFALKQILNNNNVKNNL